MRHHGQTLKMRKALASIALVLALGACSQGGTPLQPFTFNRPERVAFACFERATGLFVPVAQCEGLQLDGDTEDFALIALVTQTANGELAAVDVDDRLVLDTDVRVPGFTFARVGENPTAVVAPALAPRHVFVANRSSRTLMWLPLASLHPDAQTTTDARGELSLPGAPADMALSPDEAFLYVTIPERGAILEFALDGTNGTDPLTLQAEITLGTTVPAPVAAVDTTGYQRICPASLASTLPQPALIAPRTPVMLGATAAPTALVVDAESDPQALLIADANLPIVHRVALADTGADATALAPLAPGVPTEELALTPYVPAAVGDTSATERFLYAVDATDGSVLAIDYASASASFGAVLPVNTGHEVADRVLTGAPVSALGVVTPAYSVSGGEVNGLCTLGSEEDDDAGPASLRGVFLMVGRLDGQMMGIDVFDMDATCRGGQDCSSPANDRDVHVRIQRHRPRVGQFAEEATGTLGIPSLSFEGSPGQLSPEGLPTTGIGPSLVDLGACPPGMAKIYPDDGSATLICASLDTWASPAQVWGGVWEGALPGARTAGSFDASDPTLFVTATDRLCEWGTLGSDDVIASALSADDPLAGYAGDRMVFVDEITAEARAALEAGTGSSFERCRPFLMPDERDDVYLEIVSATEGSLRVQLPIARDATGVPTGESVPVAYTIDDIRACFPAAAPVQIHARAAYMVRGTITPFLHRVVSEGGSCRVDDDTPLPFDPADPQTRREGRGIVGRTYTSPYLAFEVAAERSDGRTISTMDGIESVFSVVVTDQPTLFVANIGRLVSEIVESPTGSDIFMIDPVQGGMLEYGTYPFQRTRRFQ